MRSAGACVEAEDESGGEGGWCREREGIGDLRKKEGGRRGNLSWPQL